MLGGVERWNMAYIPGNAYRAGDHVVLQSFMWKRGPYFRLRYTKLDGMLGKFSAVE